MQCFQNAPAYFAAAVRHEGKIFMKLAAGLFSLNLIFLLWFVNTGENRVELVGFKRTEKTVFSTTL
jgi:hypothetical protein